MTTKWNKHTYVCGNCDSLIEITTTHNDLETWCVCAEPEVILLSVADATILPITTKEEPMETTTYLQSQIDELKKQLASHQNCDYWKSENGRIQSQLIDLVNAFYEDEQNNYELVDDICTIIDYSPVKTIQFEGVIHFSGSMDVHRSELDGFDLTSALEDIYVDINNGNVVIDNYDLYSVEEPY